ncbi:MAG: hypothetical protein AAF918_00005 [Pseudomonadota bacterium]
MISILAISQDTGRRYNDVFWNGSEKKESPAPLLAIYEVSIKSKSCSCSIDAEVRPGANGLQIDWDDRLHFKTEKGYTSFSYLIFRHHSGESIEYPVSLQDAALEHNDGVA